MCLKRKRKKQTHLIFTPEFILASLQVMSEKITVVYLVHTVDIRQLFFGLVHIANGPASPYKVIVGFINYWPKGQKILMKTT